MYSLRRISDGMGDSGGMSMAIWETTRGEPGTAKWEHNARPRVGVCMRVGSTYARSFQAQDWWQTSYITEIVSDEPARVVFKTGNSEYIWTCD